MNQEQLTKEQIDTRLRDVNQYLTWIDEMTLAVDSILNTLTPLLEDHTAKSTLDFRLDMLTRESIREETREWGGEVGSAIAPLMEQYEWNRAISPFHFKRSKNAYEALKTKLPLEKENMERLKQSLEEQLQSINEQEE